MPQLHTDSNHLLPPAVYNYQTCCTQSTLGPTIKQKVNRCPPQKARTAWHVRGLRERILQLRGRYILLRVLWLQPISHSVYKQLWWENSYWLSNEGG